MTASTSVPTLAASSPASATGVPPALPFRRDDEPLFPLGGALLLFGLMAAALWLVWWDRRRHGGRRLPFLWPALRAEGDPDEDAVTLLSTTRLDAATRVHVLTWQGRRMVVAVQSGHPPVVLDRLAAPDTPSEPKP